MEVVPDSLSSLYVFIYSDDLRNYQKQTQLKGRQLPYIVYGSPRRYNSFTNTRKSDTATHYEPPGRLIKRHVNKQKYVKTYVDTSQDWIE